MLAKILETFSAAPYDYRTGWHNLIVLGDDAIRFVEVKTNDRLFDTRVRSATKIGNPKGFDCGVVHLTAVKGASCLPRQH